jgi:hypothetical protein
VTAPTGSAATTASAGAGVTTSTVTVEVTTTQTVHGTGRPTTLPTPPGLLKKLVGEPGTGGE